MGHCRLHSAAAVAATVVACVLAWPALALLTAFPATAQSDGAISPAAPTSRGASGLPVPRFVSLKSDRVNMRTGPGQQYPTKWVYSRAGLPVEIIREYEGWRQVRDAEGVTGWIVGSLLSGRRTALVAPWELKRGGADAIVALRTSDSDSSGEVARLEAGVIASIRFCDGQWCAISVGEHRGFIGQKKLWGVYPGETVR